MFVNNNKPPEALFLSFRARRNVRIHRARIYTNIAHARTEGGAIPLPTQPKQLLAHLGVRAAERCCLLLQVHPSEALGALF